MRKSIVAGNWKMNKGFEEAEDLIDELLELMDDNALENPEMVIFPPFPYLELATDLSDEILISVGAQNVSNHEAGAYTGEISASMLNSIGVKYCIVGHSERRKYFNETAKLIKAKVDLLLVNELFVIFCCGELLDERNNSNHFKVVKKQIEESLFHLSEEELSNIVIAYEPVWAIGTGATATTEQAQEMHAYIRNLLKDKYSPELANNTSILYGGSCNANNAIKISFCTSPELNVNLTPI